MSGRKQHYIPQFLLRAFARERKRDQFQIRAYFSDRSFLTATDGVAAEREFYSIVSANEETLDDRITSAEAEYAALHRTLLSTGDSVNVTAASRLLAHLAIRGAHTRETVSHMARSAMAMMDNDMRDPRIFRREAGLDGPEPVGHFKEVLDEKYNELRDKAGRAFMSRYDFHMLAHRAAQERFEELWQETVRETDWIASQIVASMPQTVAEAQRNVLDKDFEPNIRVEALAKLSWMFRSFEQHSFILPDCIAIARTSNGKIAPVFFVGHDEMGSIYFPISSTVLLQASLRDENAITPREFNKLAAESSWDLYISHPNMLMDHLRKQIGLGIRNYLETLLGAAFAGSTL